MEDKRTIAQLREQYEIEKHLAGILRSARKDERGVLYIQLYDELFRRVPHHPLLLNKMDEALKSRFVTSQIKLLNLFLFPGQVFLEIGPGDCSLSLKVAESVKVVYAVDVSEELTRLTEKPDNFKLLISNGTDIPIPADTVDLAYSNQLMEHLHPDDALEQLHNIWASLAHGGRYICITPSRVSGPHDISKYFDNVAKGFHLKEYTIQELSVLFRQAGFSKVELIVGGKGKYIQIHPQSIYWLENLLMVLPRRLRVTISQMLPFKYFTGTIKIVGTK